ncbi:MAG: AEC family transporter [Chitinispirillia bacterium]|nr:AEC family transporter [Chitinispirillia bacterium]MCL2241234.1 AEC family transporter [Chitinispirillia bacterium]
MDTAKLLEILRITLPVFALLGLGNILSRTGKMTENHQSFLNWLVYYISLPALIFAGMAGQPSGSLMAGNFIWATLLAMLALLVIYTAIAFVMRLDKKVAVIMIFSTYWSNCAYMGFPLTESAFGERGFLMAAVLNAVIMPVMVVISFVMVGMCSEKKQGILKSLRDGLANPIIMASLAGIAWSAAAAALRLDGEGFGTLPLVVREGLGICELIMKSVGAMGLSLALIAVGGKLRFRSLGRNAAPLTLAVAGKLVILPIITWAVLRALFPNTPKDVFGSAVLLMAMPTAVTCAVIAAKFKLNEEFVSAVIAVSMLGSVVMIPVWLYFVL